MFNEYDVVVSVRDLPKVPIGTVGTVLIICEPGLAYIVEFIDLKTGTSLNVLSVNEDSIKIYNKNSFSAIQ
jgi:hypothetical protein